MPQQQQQQQHQQQQHSEIDWPGDKAHGVVVINKHCHDELSGFVIAHRSVCLTNVL